MTQNKIKNLLIGKFKVESHPHFVLVDKKYHNKSEMYLQKQTLDSFIKMREAAEKDGIQLTIVSGTRNFNSQGCQKRQHRSCQAAHRCWHGCECEGYDWVYSFA